MNQISHLLAVADAYSAATGVPDSTISHRVFGDTKKIRDMRAGADITVGRYNAAMFWFAENWPAEAPLPGELAAYASDGGVKGDLPAAQTQGDAA